MPHPWKTFRVRLDGALSPLVFMSAQSRNVVGAHTGQRALKHPMAGSEAQLISPSLLLGLSPV